MERRGAAAQVLVTDVDAPVLGDADAHHLGRVLRLGPREVVIATDGRGRWRRCTYRDAAPELVPLEPPTEEPAAQRRIGVAFSPVRGARAEWVVQKLTELGVDDIVILSCDRSVVRWSKERERKAVERLRHAVVDAAAQSRRVWLPHVIGPMSLAALARCRPDAAMAEPGGPPLAVDRSLVAVGPEGGWSLEELAAEVPRVGLGPHVLRAETAALAAGALLSALRAGTVDAHG